MSKQSKQVDKEALIEQNPNVDEDKLKENSKALSKIQRLGIKKEYGLASSIGRRRVRAIDIRQRYIQLKNK